MKKFFIQMLSATNGIVSSKRVCGFLGWIVCLSIAIAATIQSLSVPAFCDLILLTSATLLGVDSITNIWKQDGTTEKE